LIKEDYFMMELTLKLDKRATDSMSDLMAHYKVGTRAELISKALAVLKIAAYIEKTEGELFARKGTHETKILVR
jgi:hypothetical protein